MGQIEFTVEETRGAVETSDLPGQIYRTYKSVGRTDVACSSRFIVA